MKKSVLIVIFQLICAAGYPQHLSLNLGTPFRRANLDVRWVAPSNALPSEVWVYRLLPRDLPSGLVSNLLAIGRFDSKEMLPGKPGEILFKSDSGSRLCISPRLGSIEYLSSRRYGPTNLAEHVPKMSQLPELTINFLKQAGISVYDIAKRPDGTPELNYSEPFTVYVVNHKFITNIQYRAVSFRRAVDGARFVGNGAGGDGRIEFGEHGRPCQQAQSSAITAVARSNHQTG